MEVGIAGMLVNEPKKTIIHITKIFTI
jgi:hypothetical protein